MKYRAFRRKKDELFYFQFLTESNEVILNSQSYTDKGCLLHGIRSVLNNAGNPDQYERSIDGDGKHFFILKAANEQEIGRSIKYTTEEALENAITIFVEEGPDSNSKSTQADASPQASSEKKDNTPSDEKPYEEGPRGKDDYRPLAFYESNISGVKNGFDTFEAEDGEFYFTYNLVDKVILISEGYKSNKSRDKGIASVTKNLSKPKRYIKEVHPNGKHYFNLRAGNNQEIATSRWFDAESEMEATFKFCNPEIRLPLIFWWQLVY